MKIFKKERENTYCQTNDGLLKRVKNLWGFSCVRLRTKTGQDSAISPTWGQGAATAVPGGNKAPIKFISKLSKIIRFTLKSISRVYITLHLKVFTPKLKVCILYTQQSI